MGKPSSPDVGEGVLTLPLAVRREILVRMGGLYNQRFRKQRPKGGRGRPPLQLEWDGCEIYAYQRAYRHTRYVGEVGIVIPTFSSVQRNGAPGTVRPTGGMHKSDRHKLYTLHKFRPPSPTWLHKTPGAEKTKKPKRGGASIRPRGQKRLKSQKGLTPVGRTVPGAPMLRNAVRGCFYDF